MEPKLRIRVGTAEVKGAGASEGAGRSRCLAPPMPRGPGRHAGSDFTRRLGSELRRRKLWVPDAGVRAELETTADQKRERDFPTRVDLVG